VPNTKEPEPVSSVTALAKLLLDGVAKNVATPVPNPDIPVDTGNPVPFVSTIADGVPKSLPVTISVPVASGSVTTGEPAVAADCIV
jgi:hypothetical protein